MGRGGRGGLLRDLGAGVYGVAAVGCSCSWRITKVGVGAVEAIGIHDLRVKRASVSAEGEASVFVRGA